MYKSKSQYINREDEVTPEELQRYTDEWWHNAFYGDAKNYMINHPEVIEQFNLTKKKVSKGEMEEMISLMLNCEGYYNSEICKDAVWSVLLKRRKR